MFNSAKFNKTTFNYMNLSTPIQLLGHIDSYSNVSSEIFRIIPLSSIIENSIYMQSNAQIYSIIHSDINSTSNFYNIISKKSNIYSAIINSSFSESQISRIAKALVSISQSSSGTSKLNKLTFQNGNIQIFSDVEVLAKNKINIYGNVNEESLTLSDVGLLFNSNGMLISTSNVNGKISNICNLNSEISTLFTISSSLDKVMGLKSDLEIISNILSNFTNYELVNSILLNGVFYDNEELLGEFANAYDRNITSEFISEILLKGIM